MQWAAVFLVSISSAFFFDYDIPTSGDLLQEWGTSPKSALSTTDTYSLVTWNIYKGGIQGLYTDLDFLQKNTTFVVMQEFLLNEEQEEMITEADAQYWALAKSFQDSGEWTGVATTSQWQAKKSLPLKSPDSEPFAGTPKMTLISLFPIQDGRELMVVNVHGLNFNLSHGAFKTQIDAIVDAVKDHNGPMIMAGDFNTWADERRTYLIKKTRTLELQRAEMENPMGIFGATLDHIFYRELSNVKYMVLDDIQTSDHLPLYLEFTLQ
jgi:endonuclease/exonuclease/phosphatase (EEP) superfamily protein YafD